MATLKTITPANNWINIQDHANINSFNLWSAFTRFAEGQKSNHILWFFVILIVHGVFFLPLPAALMYYYNAPIGVLTVTMVCFFCNLIATMGGAGIRTALLLFGASIFIHVFMSLIFIL